MPITVRDAELADLPTVYAMMAELADHEGVRPYFRLTPELLAQFLFSEPRRFHVLVAAADAAIVGYASYLFHLNPWMAREYLYLDDLYVASSHRSQGVGAELRDRFTAYWSREAMRARLGR